VHIVDKLTQVVQYADEFFHRNAIEHCASYPLGCCSIATDLVGASLVLKGFKNVKKAYQGWALFNGEKVSHSWIELNDIIIDITCYQFNDWEKPYIGACTLWHSKFEGQVIEEIIPQDEITHWSKSYSKSYELITNLKTVIVSLNI
jgi:hypothetical protein